MRTQWQTGRAYSKHGHRIIAETNLRAGHILFKDLDRHVSGRIPVVPHIFISGEFALQDLVLMNYDRGNYTAVFNNEVEHLTWDDNDVQI